MTTNSNPSALPDLIDAGLTDVTAVPIIKGEHVFGAMTLVNIGEEKRFTERDVHLLSGIGRQAGIAIENARLYERMRFYARLITKAQEDERKRIARELHDDTVQVLIALSRRIENLVIGTDAVPEGIMEGITSLQDLISPAVRDLRRSIQDLRPSLLDNIGLIAAIDELTEGLAEHNINAELRIIGEVQRLSPEKELILYRIVQEALNNIKRHSGASSAVVEIRFLPDSLFLKVEDNGQGFDVPSRIDDLVSSGRLGLLGIQEQPADMLDGILIVKSEPGEGTTISIEIPR